MQSVAAIEASPGPSAGRTLLDEVIYLASLASDRNMIDPIMDTVRNITANLQNGSVITDQDQVGLQQVRSQLTDHLLHHDKLRSFTPEELSRQVAEATGTATVRHESLKMVTRIVLLAVAAYPVGAAITISARLPDPLALASAFSTTTLYGGLIWLYISALDTFTPELRAAYRWLCFNMSALCVAAVASTVLNSFPGVSTIPLLSYGEAVLYLGLLSAVIGYEGMRRFVHAIALKTIIASWPIILMAGLALGGLAMLLPHVSVPNDGAFRISAALWVLVGTFSLSVATLGFKIARQVTSKYAQAVGWFAAAYIQATVISIGVLVSIFLNGPVHAGLPMLTIEMAMATCGISLVIAGYKFLRSVGKA